MTPIMRAMMLVFRVLCLSAAAQAQPKKGDKGVFVLAGNTFIGLGDGSGNASFGASGRLGYYFTRRNEVGGQISVADVTRHFTGNWRARPHVGYKYLLKNNVGLDFSFGYSVELNRVRGPFVSFTQGREQHLDGQVGLTFL